VRCCDVDDFLPVHLSFAVCQQSMAALVGIIYFFVAQNTSHMDLIINFLDKGNVSTSPLTSILYSSLSHALQANIQLLH